ncbi:type IV pilus biogenesis protein PilM [Intestinirhabdus alba]|jgi:pilus assembly protein HofM|uniref:DNA utilization protein HofM n=1 Tax=Intestinirhabdus alba TaxID=2899544 RepID=A0A6L6ISF3_9ENTR|nr:DNA utilization protein HofM [Intestinirhabdus alba]MTH47723.1 DNA utilization protein HofM [Intestinirhabdus alba]
MAFRFWKIGLHIQQHVALAVAVTKLATGWQLQRWWRLPLTPGVIDDGYIRDPELLTRTLRPWSRELPRRHRLHLSFPTGRTVQKSLPRPSMALREREQSAWLGGTLARELNMESDALRFDYGDDALAPAFNVTAVQSREIATLLTLAQTLNLRVAAVTPDACALQRLLPYLPSEQRCLVWRDEAQWLWATRYAWGRRAAGTLDDATALAAQLSLPPEAIAFSRPDDFDPWRAVSVRQPPVPDGGHAFAVALGLALGEVQI